MATGEVAMSYAPGIVSVPPRDQVLTTFVDIQKNRRHRRPSAHFYPPRRMRYADQRSLSFRHVIVLSTRLATLRAIALRRSPAWPARLQKSRARSIAPRCEK